MISKFSVKKPYTVLVSVIMVLVLGVVSFTRMTTDLLPNINLPYVIIMTTYVGASPETVETVVTKPLESSMTTVSNIENVSSVSSENYSMVILEFAQTTDMDSVSLEIRENIDQIKSYWDDDAISSPIIMKLNPDMMPIMVAAIGIEGMDRAQVSEVANNEIIPELESIEGVASASATGILEEKIHVIIREDKIAEINQLVFASIDEEMKDAEQELADGKQEIADGKAELATSWTDIEQSLADLEEARQEIADGLQEITDGKAELESGKTDLENTQSTTINEISAAYAKLIDGKAELVATKTTENQKIADSTAVLEAAGLTDLESLIEAYTPVIGISMLMESTDWDSLTEDQLAALRSNELVIGVYVGTSTGDAAGTAMTELANADGEGIKTKLNSTISGILTLINITQNSDEQTALSTLTVSTLTVAELDKAEAEIDKAIEELTKGQTEAAIGFAVGQAQIGVAESQLDSAQAQLEASESQLDDGVEQIDSAKEQLTDAEEQLNDAWDQLIDGEEQLADAKVDAYDSADMNGILTVDTVKALLTAQNFSMPAGYVTEDGIDYLVRVGDKPEDVEALKALPLINMNMDNIGQITLGDVADVFMTDNDDEIYANINGSNGVMVSIQKQTGYSTGDVSDKINEKFAQLMEEDSAVSMITLNDQGVYIDLIMNAIMDNIIYGAILAIFVLLFFLRSLKPTLIIACSIPISLITALVCMYFSGVTLNIISLSGLALGIGMLVDNSIVVIENIYRLRNEGYSKKEAAVEGSKEVANAIMASTLTTVCVFLPIVFVEGITRQLFVDMGLTIAYSLFASLLIALTVVPAMASKMLDQQKEVSANGKIAKLGTALLDGYEKFLSAIIRFKAVVFVVVVGFLGLSIFLALQNGTAFMTDMDSNQFTMSVTTENGTPLSETAEITNEIIEKVQTLPDILDVGAMNSSDASAMMGMGGSTATNATTIYLTTVTEKSKTNEELADEILALCGEQEGVTITIQTSSMDMSAMTGSGISLEVRGRELDTLQQIAGDVGAIIAGVEGTTDINDGMNETTEELRVLIDRDKAMEYNTTVAQIFTQIAPMLATPTTATTLTSAVKDYDVYVMNQSDLTLTREEIQNLTIDVQDEDGKKIEIPLSDVATFTSQEGLSAINRNDQTRYIQVTAGIADGYNVGLVSTDVEKALDDYILPSGYQIVLTGENESINEAMGQIALMMALAVIFMYLIMVAQFQSLLSPFIIMFTIPLAFTGGFLGLYVSGSEVSVIAMIGFVMLAGIIVNNGIVIVDYMNQLRQEGYSKKEAILEAGRTRLRPVFMTAMTTILALSTMVFSTDMGSEMAKPMAIVTIGGLMYGTLLTLFVIPCIYDLFIREKKEELEVL